MLFHIKKRNTSLEYMLFQTMAWNMHLLLSLNIFSFPYITLIYFWKILSNFFTPYCIQKSTLFLFNLLLKNNDQKRSENRDLFQLYSRYCTIKLQEQEKYCSGSAFLNNNYYPMTTRTEACFQVFILFIIIITQKLIYLKCLIFVYNWRYIS